MEIIDKVGMLILLAISMGSLAIAGYYKGKLESLESEIHETLDDLYAMYPNLRPVEREDE